MPRRVLVVDDDILVLDLVGSMLEELGCVVAAARSGHEAIAAIASDDRIEVLIADIQISGPSGSELASRARSFRQDLGIILMSGDGLDRRDGFPFLHKLFSKSDLQRAMEETTGGCG
jgi:CheY-like chemotaxis protein